MVLQRVRTTVARHEAPDLRFLAILGHPELLKQLGYAMIEMGERTLRQAVQLDFVKAP
jgi:hypothetical protein